jgi:predicted nucleotidyltransferase
MKPHLTIRRIGALFAGIAETFPDMVLAYLFGSRLEGNLGPLSDYDFAVLSDRTANMPELRAGLAHALTQALKTTRIDIVLLNQSHIELAFSVISHGRILYERNVQSRVEYEARVMGLYFDYFPVLEEERRDILHGGEHATRVQRYRKTFRRTQRTLGQIKASTG